MPLALRWGGCDGDGRSEYTHDTRGRVAGRRLERGDEGTPDGLYRFFFDCWTDGGAP